MRTLSTSDHLVLKYVHDDNSETAIKAVSSCDTIINPVTGTIERNVVDRNKYSIFISPSAGCFMKCSFCYLTTKKMEYTKLSEQQIIDNIQEAIEHQIKNQPSLRNKYVKLCWMGMGDAITDPSMVKNVSLRILDWIFENGYAIGLDGVDLATVLPPIKNDWISVFHSLEHELKKYNINPNNSKVVHSEQLSHFSSYDNRSRFRVFYSLHSSIQSKRNEMIPKSMPIIEAMSQLLDYSQNNKYNVIFHYMFIDGVNDSETDIEDLNVFLTRWNLSDYELRILRYNKCDLSNMVESQKFNDIINYLSRHHQKLKVQISTGVEISAACGQFLTPFGR